MMFEQHKHKRVSEEISEVIINSINSGDLEVGDKLPPERLLSEELGVSRSSLREALCILSGMGYINSAIGSGSYVKMKKSHE